MRKVSIQDIAKDLGLSRNTVSKALSNSESVSFDTRQKIVKRAIEMGYKKLNPELKVELELEQPSSRNTGNIIVLAHRYVADFWNQIMIGISNELKKNNYNLLFNFINCEDEAAAVLPSNIHNSQIDGIILLSVFSKEFIYKLLKTEIPLVFLDMPADGYDNNLVGDVLLVEGESSIYNITKKLIYNGYSKIGFIGDTTYCRTIFDRWRGYKKALDDFDLSLDKNLCITEAAPSHLYAYDEVSSKLGSISKLPEAFVCANDEIAMYVIRYLREKHIKVPENIAVTGFDNTIDSTLIEPALTTVHVFKEQVGVRLVQELIWRMNNPHSPFETILVNTDVIFRKSSD